MKTENISLKQSIDKLCKSLVIIQNELNDIKQQKHVKQQQDVIVDDEKKYEDESFDVCTQCNKTLYSSDFNARNVFWNGNTWNHYDCDLRENVSKLNLEDIDEWHPALSSRLIQICGKYTAIGGSSEYLNSFGIISADKGIKKWNVKINDKPQYSYIGIVNTEEIKNNQDVGRITKHCYYISYDGNICGKNVNISIGYTLKKHDVISILLDKNKNKLCFCINNLNWFHAKGAILNARYSLFCTGYYKETSFAIIGQDEKSKSNTFGICINCNNEINAIDVRSDNISWNNKQNGWIHVDCNVKPELISELQIADRDQWNALFSHSAVSINNKHNLVGGSSSYLYSFGTITVNKGIKVWDIKINKKPSYLYLGIINSKAMKPETTGNYSWNIDNGYYLTYTGSVKGQNVDISSHHKLKENDIIKIILNMKEYELCFGINNTHFIYAKGAVLKNCSFNLAVITYDKNTSVSILSNDEEKHEEEAGFAVCTECNKALYQSDFDSKNIFWNENKNRWNHVKCNLKQTISKLSLEDIDEWHPSLTNPSIQISAKYTSIGGSSEYLNSFGTISVDKGIKKWDVKINDKPQYSYIGIINTEEITNHDKGQIYNANCYYLSYDGTIRGENVEISIGYTLKKNDIISIILDKNKNELFFCINNSNAWFAKGAVLNGAYNLFVTSYDAKTSFTIIGAESMEETKTEMDSFGNCANCQIQINEIDFRTNNVSWNNKQNEWLHCDCDMKQESVPKLKVTDVDQWNALLSHSTITINNKYNLVGGSSCYLHSFGIITVNKGIKVWDIKINEKPSYLYLGIIHSKAMKSEKN